jgi:predicted site-specific integrase-resolvase
LGQRSKVNCLPKPTRKKVLYARAICSVYGIQKENKVGKIVIYGRVSSAGQKEDLANQLSFLRDFANARGLILDEVLTDIGSGLNYKR